MSVAEVLLRNLKLSGSLLAKELSKRQPRAFQMPPLFEKTAIPDEDELLTDALQGSTSDLDNKFETFKSDDVFVENAFGALRSLNFSLGVVKQATFETSTTCVTEGVEVTCTGGKYSNARPFPLSSLERELFSPTTSSSSSRQVLSFSTSQYPPTISSSSSSSSLPHHKNSSSSSQQQQQQNSFISLPVHVVIRNHSPHTITLLRRKWWIWDAVLNTTRNVEGDGVIGQRPTILPGKEFSYATRCNCLNLTNMWGHYLFAKHEGFFFGNPNNPAEMEEWLRNPPALALFHVQIPRFSVYELSDHVAPDSTQQKK